MSDLSEYNDDLKQLTESELGDYIYKQWNRFLDAQPFEDATWLIGALRIRWQELHEDEYSASMSKAIVADLFGNAEIDRAQ